MLKIRKREFWFVVGSQHLYGDQTLSQVKDNAKIIVKTLNDSGKMRYPIVLKGLATTQTEITKIMKEVNYCDDVAGVITWMHTFSPAKMWIRGTQLLQKPLLHLSTQYNEAIPWDTIDMDFMNLNQSAHGDREYGFINKRLNKKNEVIVGYWKSKDVQKRISSWMDVAVSIVEGYNIRVARFGDNMRNVAVTDGDKIEAQIKFGWTVDYYGIGDLVEYIDHVTEKEVDKLLNEYKQMYIFDYGNYDEDIWIEHVKEQARQEIALKRFLEDGNYNAFTTNFEDLHGMKQLPGLSVQRLMNEGYGFAGEGDWKTAALSRFMKIMSDNKTTGFMEDYTYDMTPGEEVILQSHMLEVDPTFSNTKPRIVVSPLTMGNKNDPARLVFDGVDGNGIVATLVDFGDKFKLIVNEIKAEKPKKEAPHLPVARVMWKPLPDFETGIESWLRLGGGHHTVASLALTKEQLLMWALQADLEVEVIT